jgi:hypothetical protein
MTYISGKVEVRQEADDKSMSRLNIEDFLFFVNRNEYLQKIVFAMIADHINKRK